MAQEAPQQRIERLEAENENLRAANDALRAENERVRRAWDAMRSEAAELERQLQLERLSRLEGSRRA